MASAVISDSQASANVVDVAGVNTPRPVLLVTTVDIGEGKADHIEYRKGDDATELARLFVAKHGLPTSITLPLAQHILDNLKQALKVTPAKNAAGRVSPPRPPRPHSAGKISPRSENSHVSGGSGAPRKVMNAAAFERLYQRAELLRKQADDRRAAIAAAEAEALAASKVSMSWISAEMMKERGPGPFDNYGEMLYAEGLDAAARRNAKAAVVKQQRVQAEVSGLTFKPEISAMAKHLFGPDSASVPAWQRLSHGRKSKTQERLDALRREKEAAEIGECTFKPRINARSDRLMAERTEALRARQLTAHQQLFQDAVRRQQKQAEVANWCPEEATFQPLLLARPPRGMDPSNQPLVERLYEAWYKLQDKLKEARAKLAAIDPVTGRPLYQPLTGRAPPGRGVATSSESVGLALYARAQEALQAKAARVAAEKEEERRRAALVRVNKTSNVLIRKLQHKRFRQIFKFLDSSSSGVLNLQELVEEHPALLEELNDEVRADVELAAALAGRIAQQRGPNRLESSKSEAKSEGKSEASIFMPVPDSRMVRSLNGKGAKSMGSNGSSGSRPSSAPNSPRLDAAAQHSALANIRPTAVSFPDFCQLMEEALSLRRGPREYLAPTPPPPPEPEGTFHPEITEKSKQLAVRLRPPGIPVYEVLHKEASSISAKLEQKRRVAAANAMAGCTFAPKLVSERLVKEGVVMKAVRNGGSPGSSISGQPGAGSPDGFSASLQQLAAHLMTFDALPGEQHPGAEHLEAVVETDEEEEEEEEEHLAALADEVETVMDAAGAVAEAAAALQEGGVEGDGSEQQYLTRVLGLAQAQADAMEPVISQLAAWEAAPSANSTNPAAAAANTSTFVVADRELPVVQPNGAAASPMNAEEVEQMVAQLNQEIGQLLQEVHSSQV